MSDSELVAEKRVKKDKKDKKEKKEKKRKAAEPVSENDEAGADSADEKNGSKKRKREILPDEIEIDVSLPEPASKKAARKAKKAKTQPASTADAENGEAAQEKEDDKKEEGKRSEYSVWIGNLPWSATKESLRTFLTSNSEIKDEEITRVHMPVPKAPPRPNWTDAKPQNKGFAYVDFSTQLAMYSAIALTETRMDRRPLLIKNAKSFEGRPEKPKEAETHIDTDGRINGKLPNKKIFVGNLGFETTKEELTAHFKPCGAIENIHMATFEDTGKCKGYAWVTFEEIEAATSAVKGYVYKKEAKSEKKNSDDEDNEAVSEKNKKRKYKLNKLLGRDLRCEFAEDSTTRYQKRFGKEKPEDGGADGEQGGFRRQQRGGKPFTPRNNFRDRKVDARTIAPGAAHTSAPRASAAIVKSEGKKTTFE